MVLRSIVAFLTLSTSCVVAAETNFEFKLFSDDFSNKEKMLLSIDSDDKSSRMLLHCVTGGELQTQFHLDIGTIFPDEADVTNGRMFVDVMHKFTQEDEPTTSRWIMAVMKYSDAWYQGDARAFLEAASNSERLAMKLLKNNSTFRYNTSAASEHFKQLLSHCSFK